jgi:thiamine pyrophosphate-dependent acetolactate synthase large subunit-like protein
MIRLADYVAQTLVRHGCDRVFLITGGLAMHLNDAIGKCPGLSYTCCHHEQTCAMAAEGYARIRNRPAVVQITGGPGGINTLNGVFGAYTDSIPMLILSGQAKRETCLSTYDLPGLRQLGDQEVEIVPMVRGITKYAVFVRDPLTIRRELEKALYLSTHGRPGPCWLDIPVDVQSTMIDENTLEAYDPTADEPADDPARLPFAPRRWIGSGKPSGPSFLLGAEFIWRARSIFSSGWSRASASRSRSPGPRPMRCRPITRSIAAGRERSAIGREISRCRTPT